MLDNYQLSIINYQWYYTLIGDRQLPPLLLIHGWMGSSVDYTEVIELVRSQFYCIAIDLPGHGQTEVVGDDTAYEFSATAVGIIQLLDSLQIDLCTICGYSFGGRMALYLALEFPDRFDRVLLESTSPGLATIEERQARIINDDRLIQRLATDNFEDFVNAWYRQEIFTTIEEHPNFVNLIERRLKNRSTNLAKSLKYAGLGRQPYLGDRLNEFHGEILLIVGELDRKFLSIAQTLDRAYPHITLIVAPNCSHNVHFQSPEFWAKLLSRSCVIKSESDRVRS